MAIRALFLTFALASTAAAEPCRSTGGNAGPHVVLLAHGEDARADLRTAREALERSIFGANGLRFHEATLPAATCERVAKNTLVPYLRCSAALNDVLATCGVAATKVVVLSRLAFTSRGEVARPEATAGAFVSTAGPAETWTADLRHEVAHLFGLRDERPVLTTPQKGLAGTPGPNCAATRDEARRRWGDLAAREMAGYFAGCAGHRDFWRPHERTAMDDPRRATSFGAVGERYLRMALQCCFSDNRAGCVEAAARDPELAACVKR